MKPNPYSSSSQPFVSQRAYSGIKRYGSIHNDFDESKVKRDEDGKFSTTGGSSGGAVKPVRKRIAGKLDTSDKWEIVKTYHVKEMSAHGSETAATCAHCDKSIKAVVEMKDPKTGDNYKVGEDCAAALAEGSAKSKLDASVKDFKRKERDLKGLVSGVLKLSVIGEASKELKKSALDEARRLTAKGTPKQELSGKLKAFVKENHKD